ncbi:MAG TPA: hypothetical protein VL588_10025 [Bdellovibrionota bacterium]|nr:hypothetical protein [Bdellovibrionota bacterium]
MTSSRRIQILGLLGSGLMLAAGALSNGGCTSGTAAGSYVPPDPGSTGGDGVTDPLTHCPQAMATGGYATSTGSTVTCNCPGSGPIGSDGPCPGGGNEDPRNKAVLEAFAPALSAKNSFDQNVGEAKKFVDDDNTTFTQGTTQAATAGTKSGKGTVDDMGTPTSPGDTTGAIPAGPGHGVGGGGGKGLSPSDGLTIGKVNTDPAKEETPGEDPAHRGSQTTGAVYSGGGAVGRNGSHGGGNDAINGENGRFVDFGADSAAAKAAADAAKAGAQGQDQGSRMPPQNPETMGTPVDGPMGTPDRDDYFALIPRHGNLFEIISDRYRAETSGW